MSYTLTMNARQTQVVIAALDLLARLGIGQWEVLVDHVPEEGIPFADVIDHRDEVRRLLSLIKETIGHPGASGYSISHRCVSDFTKVAYDLECVLRKAVVKAEDRPSYNVWHHEPLHVGTEPLAIVEAV